jgi:hypothetical protein
VTDSDLGLDAAGFTSGPLAHRNRDAITMHVKPLWLDLELVEDLQLHLDRRSNLVESAMCAAKQALLGLEPFEVLVEKCESRLEVAPAYGLLEGPDRRGRRVRPLCPRISLMELVVR